MVLDTIDFIMSCNIILDNIEEVDLEMVNDSGRNGGFLTRKDSLRLLVQIANVLGRFTDKITGKNLTLGGYVNVAGIMEGDLNVLRNGSGEGG